MWLSLSCESSEETDLLFLVFVVVVVVAIFCFVLFDFLFLSVVDMLGLKSVPSHSNK